MRSLALSACLAGTVLLSACTVAPPPGPSILAQPGPGKTAAQFAADDAHCRAVAAQANGGLTPAQAANRSGVGSAALGTVLGAVAGVVIGAAVGDPGAGAAIGGGSGLLLGASAGANAAANSGAAFQANYDAAYAQCTRASGNLIAVPAIVSYATPDVAGSYAPGLLVPVPPHPPAVVYPAVPVAPGYAY
ncbi:glycine zipper family protein [Acetobacteraceae bacterium KSS8]|uniref:Glycine zipper family protein n=1 Tax=Endosaccharibacter trunci TaxID=2812733 RepID=A0ABT1W5V6_9PROT|nr:glycine zipper family protein [Acetobacteraceae bacterium KSS8]